MKNTLTIAATAISMPVPAADGQVLIASDGAFVPATPVISETGEWMTSDSGTLIVTR